ncbi:MAG: TlpA disulfide reductase family protein [Saprospiraceae bacterium]
MLKAILTGLIWLSMISWSHAALVQGVVKGAKSGSTVELAIQHYYLDGKVSKFTTQLDEQSRFSLEVQVLEPGIAFFKFNRDHLPIFLANDDTLYISTDIFQFPVQVSFAGSSGAENQLLKEFLKQSQYDFIEFNNIRYKIGLSWIAVEESVNGLMEALNPEQFQGAMDARKQSSLNLIKSFQEELYFLNDPFLNWLTTEITYNWAFNLLVYGQVFGNRYGIAPEFFNFLITTPLNIEEISSEQYRNFVVASMARQQFRASQNNGFWSGQYKIAENLLSGKALAFFRAELISTAFSTEYYKEILPLYTDFMQNNEYVIFDARVEDLYQKVARVSAGTNAPDFDGLDKQGHPITLTQFRGKVVYLNFWASWCGACLRKMDFFDEFETELNANGIEIVNISIDEAQQNWSNALNQHLYKGHHLLASSDYHQNIAKSFGVEAVPQYFIIGRNGLFEEKPLSNQPNDVRQKLLEISALRN